MGTVTSLSLGFSTKFPWAVCLSAHVQADITSMAAGGGGLAPREEQSGDTVGLRRRLKGRGKGYRLHSWGPWLSPPPRTIRKLGRIQALQANPLLGSLGWVRLITKPRMWTIPWGDSFY